SRSPALPGHGVPRPVAALPQLLQHALGLRRRALERRVLIRTAYHRQRFRMRAVDEERIAKLLLRIEAAETDADRYRDLLLPCQFHWTPPLALANCGRRAKQSPQRAAADGDEANRMPRTLQWAVNRPLHAARARARPCPSCCARERSAPSRARRA